MALAPPKKPIMEDAAAWDYRSKGPDLGFLGEIINVEWDSQPQAIPATYWAHEDHKHSFSVDKPTQTLIYRLRHVLSGKESKIVPYICIAAWLNWPKSHIKVPNKCRHFSAEICAIIAAHINGRRTSLSSRTRM